MSRLEVLRGLQRRWDERAGVSPLNASANARDASLALGEALDLLAASEDRAEQAREIFGAHLHRLQDECAEMATRAEKAEREVAALNEKLANLQEYDQKRVLEQRAIEERAEKAERERDEISALARCDTGELWSAECERARTERDAARAEAAAIREDAVGKLALWRLQKLEAAQTYAAALREVFIRFATYQGPCADHHRDDCLCPGDCEACNIDLATNAVLHFDDPQAALALAKVLLSKVKR